MEIKKSSEIAASERTTTISIGGSRVGKTHFIGTACDVRRVFILDTEDGLKTIADKKFDYFTANNWTEVQQVLNWYMSEGHSNYDVFAIDSINRLQHYMLDAIKADSAAVGVSGDKYKGEMTMNKWGLLTAQTKKIVDLLTKLCPTSVHMNVTAMESKDEVTGMVMLYPALSGAFKHEILGYFDTILYHKAGIEKGEQKYWCQLAADSRVQAGTRLQVLRTTYGNVMPNDYACIHNALISSNGTAQQGV